jgi:putative sigma-54 modulation protein
VKIDVTGRNFEVEDKLLEYVTDKLNSLEKYVPRATRETVHAAVVLEDDTNGREDNRYVCDVIVTVPGARLVAREGTVNMYAAIDIVEAKLQSQLTKYKEKHAVAPRRGRILSRWLGRAGGEAPKEEPATE